MMNKSFHFDSFIFPVKPCLAAFILFEGMQLVDEKARFVLQDSRGFREDEGKVRDVFQNEIADNEIKLPVIAGPLTCNIRYRKSDILCAYILFGFLDHSLRKIKRVDAGSNLGEKRGVLSRSASYLKDRV